MNVWGSKTTAIRVHEVGPLARSADEEELLNPAGALRNLSPWRCFLMGLGAAVSGFAAALVGLAFLIVPVIRKPGAGHWLTSTFGMGMLIVSGFFTWFACDSGLGRGIGSTKRSIASSGEPTCIFFWQFCYY